MTTVQEQSEYRRAENEVIFREHNARLKRQVKVILPAEDKTSFPVSFVCECSDEKCQDTVTATVTEFERIHGHSRWFMVKRGHNQPDIERIIESHDEYDVNEKYDEPPETDGKLNSTNAEEKTIS